MVGQKRAKRPVRRKLRPGRPQVPSWHGPPCLKCGRPVQPAYAAIVPALCEACYVVEARRFHGRSQAVQLFSSVPVS